MLIKTKGIALHYIKYGDNSIIVTIYTKSSGRQSFIVKGAFGKKSQVRANLFAPLNLLELEVENKPGRDLQIIKEAINNPSFGNLHISPFKNAIAVFIAEVLYRSMQEQEPNERLFEFMFNAFQILDHENANNAANFHLAFLVQLLKFSGFYPQNNFSELAPVFDLMNGRFEANIPAHGFYVTGLTAETFSKIVSHSFEQALHLPIKRDTRLQLLEKITEYYKLHFSGMGQIKSLQILREVFE